MNKFFKSLFTGYTSLSIALVLIAFWLFASLAFNNQIAFSVLTHVNSTNDIVTMPVDKLTKGMQIVGEFKSEEDYLGLILLKFENYTKPEFINEDIIRFRIKEIGQKEWYHLSYHRSGAFEGQRYFPFGFQPIADSKNKKYIFEIESTRGDKTNSINPDSFGQFFLSGHQIPKQKIISSKENAVSFLIKKASFSIVNLDFVLSSLIFSTPLSIYLLLLIFKKKYKVIINGIPWITLSIILFDILVLQHIYLGIIAVLAILWIFSIAALRIEGRISVIVSLVFVIFWLFLYSTSLLTHAYDKLNTWSYLFLVIGVIQLLLEEKYKFKNIKVTDFLKRLIYK